MIRFNSTSVGTREKKPWYSVRLIITYIVLGFAFPGIIGLVFMQYVYYDAMIAVMEITNTQLGLLITIEALGAVFLALPCGILVDRFDCKKMMSISLFVTTIGCIIFALMPKYQVALVVWTIFAVTMCGFYPAIYKVVRIIASEKNQGKSYGFFGVCNAIGFMVVNFLALRVYTVVEASGGMSKGLSAVLWIFAGVLAISTVFGYLLVRGVENPEGDVTEVNKFSLRDLTTVLKMPGTWLVFVVGFAVNSLHLTMSYFTPYFTSVLGMAIVFSGVIAVIRQYGLRLISSPLGGWYGDKIGSRTKVICFSLLASSLLILLVIFMPHGTALPVVIALIMFIALLDNMTISLCYSIFGEALIPNRYMGTVLGVITIILPDLFEPVMYGYWLDTYGNNAYMFIFSFAILLCILGAIACTIIIHRYKKYKEEYQRQEMEFISVSS